MRDSYLEMDLAFGSIALADVPAIGPNTVSVAITQMPDTGAPCMETGMVCSVRMLIETKNPVPDDDLGGYLEARLPDGYFIAATKCSGMLEGEHTVPCQIVTTKIIHLKLEPGTQEKLDKVSYSFTIDIEGVDLPLSTRPTRPPLVETYEVLEDEDEVRRQFVIDSNADDTSTVDIIAPSEFKSISVSRDDTTIGSKTSLTLNLQTRWEESLEFDNLKIVIEVPETTGQILSYSCSNSYDLIKDQYCKHQSNQEIWLTNLRHFCDKDTMTCSVSLTNFYNAAYSTKEPHPLNDSIRVTLMIDEEAPKFVH